VPTDAANLCWQAADRFGLSVKIALEKNLPPASGIGGGSSDAAAVIRALEQISEKPAPFDPVELGADLPVCLIGRASHMQGIGDQVCPLEMEPVHAVLVNPGVGVSTPLAFSALRTKNNRPMTPMPAGGGKHVALRWLKDQRNDLQAPVISLVGEIGKVLTALAAQDGCELARMSGSGATCFGLFDSDDEAAQAAIQLQRPGWWVRQCTLS